MNMPPLQLVQVSGGFPGQAELLPGADWPRASITGLPAPRQDLTSLLATLIQLGEAGRWICLVAPPRMPDSATLHAAGIDPSRILLVHPKAHQDDLRVVEESLRCGNCSAVLAWTGQEDEVTVRRLQRAAKAGDTRGFLLWQAWPKH